jgi:hypothetical protein
MNPPGSQRLNSSHLTHGRIRGIQAPTSNLALLAGLANL